jgi:hypothetical protein
MSVLWLLKELYLGMDLTKDLDRIPKMGTKDLKQTSKPLTRVTRETIEGEVLEKNYGDYRSNSLNRRNSLDRGRRTEYRSDSQNRGHYEKPRSNSRDRPYFDDSKRGEKKDNYSQRGYDSYRSNSKDFGSSDDHKR